MALTWKDMATTILAGLVATFSYFYIIGYNFPIITGYRGAILVLLGLGIGMCALSSAGAGGPWIGAASILGVLSLILIVAGLIMGTKIIFLATAGVILLLWAIATLRHIVGG
jgi:hypothetical protein